MPADKYIPTPEEMDQLRAGDIPASAPVRLADDYFIMPFGKHRDKPIGQVPASYLRWCAEDMDAPNWQIVAYWAIMKDGLEKELEA